MESATLPSETLQDPAIFSSLPSASLGTSLSPLRETDSAESAPRYVLLNRGSCTGMTGSHSEPRFTFGSTTKRPSTPSTRVVKRILFGKSDQLMQPPQSTASSPLTPSSSLTKSVSAYVSKRFRSDEENNTENAENTEKCTISAVSEDKENRASGELPSSNPGSCKCPRVSQDQAIRSIVTPSTSRPAFVVVPLSERRPSTSTPTSSPALLSFVF